jgi:hypothetical protein
VGVLDSLMFLWGCEMASRGAEDRREGGRGDDLEGRARRL